MEVFKATNEAIDSEECNLKVLSVVSIAPILLGSAPIQELQIDMEMKKSTFSKLQKRIAQRCVLYFNNYVRRRGYNGALKFDMKNKQVEIIVSSHLFIA